MNSPSKHLHQFYHVSSIVLSAIPIVLAVFLVYRCGINVLYRDEWILVPLLEKWKTGELTFTDLFYAHNQHRLFFPRIFVVGLAFLTNNYNSVVFMYLGQVSLLVGLWAIYSQAKRQFRFTLTRLPLWFVPLPFLLFNWRQLGNFLWGFQLGYILPLPCTLVSLYALQQASDRAHPFSAKHLRYLIYALLFATLATYSMMMGVFVWVAGMCLMMFGKIPRSRLIVLWSWMLVGIAEWIGYFHGFPKTDIVFDSVSRLFEMGYYFLSLLGNLAYSERYAAWHGAILVFLFLFVLARGYAQRLLQEQSFWIATGAYSACVLASITLGRSHQWSASFMWSRYATYSVPWIIATYGMFIILLKHRHASACYKIDVSMFGVLLSIIVIGITLGYTKGWHDGQRAREFSARAAMTILYYETVPDDMLTRVYPSVEYIKKHAPFLKVQQYNVFHQDEIRARYLVEGKIDFRQRSSERLLYTGWSDAEDWGRWAITREALMFLMLPERRSYTMKIRIQSPPLKEKVQSVAIFLNNTLLQRITLPQGQWIQVTIEIPEVVLTGQVEVLKFDSEHALSPFQQGISVDKRALAVGVESIQIH